MTTFGVRLQARQLPSIDAVAADQWNALDGTDCPFLRHEFLAAMEHSGCAQPATGWQPAHVVLYAGAELVAAAPAYLKTHSWGEFVFDFGWARAYASHGLDYYPKLTCAVPFSPVNGARLLTKPGAAQPALRDGLVEALMQFTRTGGMSSAHALFIDPEERGHFAAQGWLLRRDVQFHWHNEGYGSFEDYLAGFTAEKRKKIRRERRRCAEAGIVFETLTGAELSPELLLQVYQLHAQTFHRHGHEPYLNPEFFTALAGSLPDALLVTIGRLAGQVVAAAVFLRSDSVLYGRYWGAAQEFHSLHFETCYHQGIEYCIANGLQRFEPGTQGEHKVSRGFRPALTWSAHYIADGRFRAAIEAFLEQEGPAVDAYAAEIAGHSPFRRA